MKDQNPEEKKKKKKYVNIDCTAATMPFINKKDSIQELDFDHVCYNVARV